VGDADLPTVIGYVREHGVLQMSLSDFGTVSGSLAL